VCGFDLQAGSYGFVLQAEAIGIEANGSGQQTAGST
jgi:hypothetical protein